MVSSLVFYIGSEHKPIMEGITNQQQPIYSEDDSLDSYYDQFIPNEYPGDEFEDSGEEFDDDFHPYEDQEFEDYDDLMEQGHMNRHPEDYNNLPRKW